MQNYVQLAATGDKFPNILCNSYNCMVETTIDYAPLNALQNMPKRCKTAKMQHFKVLNAENKL